MNFLRRLIKLLKNEPDVPRIIMTKKPNKDKISRIRTEVKNQFEKIVGDIEAFCSVVETLNRDLEDERLLTEDGTMEAMAELRDYNSLFDSFVIPVILGRRDEEGEKKIYFEV